MNKFLLNRWGALHGMKRRYFGLESNASYQKRVFKKAVIHGQPHPPPRKK